MDLNLNRRPLFQFVDALNKQSREYHDRTDLDSEILRIMFLQTNLLEALMFQVEQHEMTMEFIFRDLII